MAVRRGFHIRCREAAPGMGERGSARTFGWRLPNCNGRHRFPRADPQRMGSSERTVVPREGSSSSSISGSPVTSFLGDPRLPSPDSLVAVLEALMAVRSLRHDRGADLDRYYIASLGGADDLARIERQSDPNALPQFIADLILALRDSARAGRAVLAGKAFHVALREEVLIDGSALDRALNPLLGRLFRLAARGHWIRARCPIRMPQRIRAVDLTLEPLSVGRLCARASLNKDGDLDFLLTMHDRGVSYPLGPYPEIQEFGAMLNHLEAGQAWDGLLFDAFGETTGPSALFHFCRRADRVRFTFAEEDWKHLKELFSMIMLSPQVRLAADRLSLEYGDL